MRSSLFLLVLGCAQVNEGSYALPNGLKVDVVAAPRGETVAVALSWDVGGDHDPDGRSGMTHLLARLLGAPLHVESGSDHLTLATAVPAAKLDETLDDFAARMSALRITGDDLARERASLLEELARTRGGNAALSAMTFAAEALRPSRAGWRGGVPAELERITAEEAQAFYDEHLKAGGARLVIVGNVDPTRIHARIEAAFGKISEGTSPARRPPAASTVTGTLVMGDVPSAVALAVGAPAPAEPLYTAFLVLAARLRALEPAFSPLEQPGLLLVSGKIAGGERPDDAAARIRKEVTALVTAPLTSSELRAAPGLYAASLGTVPLKPDACAHDPLAVALVKVRAAQLHVDGRALAQALESVTAAQLADAAKLFDAQRTAAVVAGGAIPTP